VHFCEQIGVSQGDFELALLGEKWLSRKDFPFSALKSRKVRCFHSMTVDLISSTPLRIVEAGVESPAAKSSLIVSRAAPSLSSSWAIPVSRLLRSIKGRAPQLPVQEPENRTTAQHDSSTKTAQQEPENQYSSTTGDPTLSITSEGTEAPAG
jgi:hypothetical protein